MKALERMLAGFVENCTKACAGGRAADCVMLEDLADAKGNNCCR